MKKLIKGKVWKFKDNINTDEIIPAKYLNTSNIEEIVKYCFENTYPEFAQKIKPNDIIVAGENFGCGSSREHAALVIKNLKISCIIAKSFARIFYRNSINIGLLALECKNLEASHFDEVEIDLDRGKIKNLTQNKIYKFPPFPPFMQELIEKQGLLNYIKSLENNLKA